MDYIFNTFAKANKYEKDVTALHRYQENTHWADVEKHPTKDKWAVRCSPKLILEDQEAQEKTSDWYQIIE
jgi:hypothetical protein